MHTALVPEQVNIMKIQAGIQVSKTKELRRQLQLWKRFERLHLIVFVLVRNIIIMVNLPPPNNDPNVLKRDQAPAAPDGFAPQWIDPEFEEEEMDDDDDDWDDDVEWLMAPMEEVSDAEVGDSIAIGEIHPRVAIVEEQSEKIGDTSRMVTSVSILEEPIEVTNADRVDYVSRGLSPPNYVKYMPYVLCALNKKVRANIVPHIYLKERRIPRDDQKPSCHERMMRRVRKTEHRDDAPLRWVECNNLSFTMRMTIANSMS
nr:hypothetical protein [Tanacetum cinerariifolium]